MDDYLDQAVAHKVKQVRVIHGMGTGKLRNAVWRDLDKHPQVKSKTSAGPSEGGLWGYNCSVEVGEWYDFSTSTG